MVTESDFPLAADPAHVMSLCLGLIAATVVTAATRDRRVDFAGGDIPSADDHERPTTPH